MGVRVEVEFYAGGRGEESPRAIVMDGDWLSVQRVLERRLVEASEGGRYREFRIRLVAGGLWVLREREGGWEIEEV